MTTRIETQTIRQNTQHDICFMTNFHDNKDWNTMATNFCSSCEFFFMTNFHDNKDWNLWQRFQPQLYEILYDQLPWQQGLKLDTRYPTVNEVITLWPTSMTTRIETYPKPTNDNNVKHFMTNFHDNKDWNAAHEIRVQASGGFMTNFHDNKDWNPYAGVAFSFIFKALWPTSMTTRIETP